MDYKVFKNEISNLKAYYQSLIEINNDLERLSYDLTGVKGVRFDRQPGSFNPSLSEYRKLDLIEKIEEKEKELDYTQLAIKRYESNLNKLPKPIRDAVVQIFIQGRTFAEMGKLLGYSDHGLHYKIKKEVEKI